MKRSTLWMMLFTILCCLAWSSRAQAQDVIGYSQITFDESTNTVYGYSDSELDYSGDYHYSAYVEGYLYDEFGNVLDSGYAESYFIAEVVTSAPALPARVYTVFSDHYLIARYYTTVRIYDCDPYWCDYCYDYYWDDYYGYGDCYGDYWYDPWGFSFWDGGYYGPWWDFYGYGEPANLEVEYIYLGTTFDSLLTPPDTCGYSESSDPAAYGYYDSSYSSTANFCSIRPSITGPSSVWWFNGESPTGYATQITLLTTSSGTSWQWRVVSGAGKVTLLDNGSSSVTVQSAAPSGTEGDVSIQVTVNGITSAPFKLTVRAPYSLQSTGPNNDLAQGSGYRTYVNYQVNQQIGNAKMPTDVPVTELFPNAHTDYVANTWPYGCPGGGVATNAYFADQINVQDTGPSPTPAPCNPGTCTEFLVDEIFQQWYVGNAQTGVVVRDKFYSTCPTGTARGRLVQTDTLQRYTDRGDHANVVSPPQ